MAQIRKYQPGGKTPKKIGVLTIDGKEYTGDGFIQHMRDYRKTLDDKVADQFGNIINALEAGENLQYDSDSDVLTGNVNWNVSKLQDKRLDKGEDRTKIGKIFGGLNEGKEQRVRYAINALRGMGTYEEPKEEVKGKSVDWSKDINLVYSKGKDGKRTFSKLDNANAVDRLNQFATLIGSDWTDNDTFTGYNGLTRDQYMKAYTDLTDAISAVENGTWDENTLKVLKDFGIFDKGTISTNTDNNNNKSTNGNGENFGVVDSNGFSNSVHHIKDSYGNLTVADKLEKLFPGNWDFSRNFEQSDMWTKELDYLKDYIKWNGRLYKASDLDNPNSEFYKIYHNSDVYSLLNKGEFEKAGKLLHMFPNKNETPWIKYDRTSSYIPILKDSPLSHYRILGYDESGNPHLEYIVPDTDLDRYGVPGKRYGKFDGNEWYFPASSYYKETNYDTQKGNIKKYDLIQEDPYKGMYKNIESINGLPELVYYINPNDNDSDVIVDLLKNAPGGRKIKISRNIWNIINKGGLQKILQSEFKDNFINDIQNLIRPNISRAFQSGMYRLPWQSFGITPDEAQMLYDYFNSDENKEVRRGKHEVRVPIVSKKHGGVIKGEKGLYFDPRTGMWESNGTPIVFTKENGIEPHINFATDNLNDIVETILYDKENPILSSSEQYLINTSIRKDVPNFKYTPSTQNNPTKPNLSTTIDNPFAITKSLLAGPLGEKYSIENFENRTLTQNSNESNDNQTSENDGEAPPKWRQNLKDYASRAFNYENLNTLGQIVGAVAANHKVAKVKENALKSMPLSRNVFQASTPAYYENTRGFDVRRNTLLNAQLPQTADAKLNAQWKLNIASELDKVNREKYDYLSQNRNQYNQFVNQIENKNRELQVAESNAFMDRAAQRNMALAENTAGTIANDFKTFEQALKKGLYNYQQDRAIYDQLALSDRKKILFDKYLKAATDWAKTNKAGAGEENMSDIDRYFKYNQTAKDLFENDVMQLNKSIYKPHSLWSPRFAKKGGKLSAQDHIKINKHKSQDRILENKYKAIDKAVQKLNDNVIKIFLNMMK